MDEVLIMLPLVSLFFIIGLFPNLFFDKVNRISRGVGDQQQARIQSKVQAERR